MVRLNLWVNCKQFLKGWSILLCLSRLTFEDFNWPKVVQNQSLKSFSLLLVKCYGCSYQIGWLVFVLRNIINKNDILLLC